MKPKIMFLVLLLAAVKIQAQENFCAICSREAWEGDSVALNKFMNSCGVVDTVAYDSLDAPTKAMPVYKKITMKLHSGQVLFSDKLYMVSDHMPEFEGGEKALIAYLSKNIRYPATAKENKKQGVVYLQFVIEKNGTVSNVQVKRSIDTELDTEAIRVVKAMPKWKGGTHKGQPVRVQYNLPVRFKLS